MEGVVYCATEGCVNREKEERRAGWHPHSEPTPTLDHPCRQSGLERTMKQHAHPPTRIRPPSISSSHAASRTKAIWPSSGLRPRSPACAASSGLLLLETDGVCIDTHMDAHRVAFNKALADLGYDASEVGLKGGGWPLQSLFRAPSLLLLYIQCAQFTPPIYTDLLAGGDGTAE
jgi:hypothetical protein